MIILGLTGSIAMGKSATAMMFTSYGVPVFDADGCVHTLIGPSGKLVPLIAKEFPDALEKTNNIEFINRDRLGNIVFKNKKMKLKLENIIHPQIGKERKKWTEWASRQRHKIICYDIPLLFETKGENACDKVIVVSAPWLIQKQRALKRKNMDLQKFNNILKTQITDEDKRKRADFIVYTGNGYRFARNQVGKIIRKLSQ
jgi:dephospho-CoA kinase